MATPRTVAFHTLGCKLNYAETSSVRRLFENDGYTVVAFEDEADVYVLNTCSVTENADRECRKSVRQVHRQNPDARIVVMGCYAQLKPQEISEIEGVNLVLGAAEKFNLLRYLEAASAIHDRASVLSGDIQLANDFHSAFSLGDRTRSFLKVQDGCDYKCTFCTIPKARGASRSAGIDQVIRQAQEIGRSGVKEIVLTGVNVGDFGNGTSVIEGVRPKKEAMLIDLIKALDHVEEIERFRISSIEPNLCTGEIIEFVANSNKFMPHFHMPLQSGSNEILKLMRRRYMRDLYAERVAMIKNQMPHACIGVDVISGFPGETDQHFQDTFDFLLDLDIDYIHPFSYSEREDTPAASMPGKVLLNIRRYRSQVLRDLSLEKKSDHYNKHFGEVRKVLFEKGPTSKLMSGFTDNYIRIIAPLHPDMINTIQPVELNSVIKQNGELYSTIHQPEASYLSLETRR